MLVGSSNLTEAAFSTNYEANLYSHVTLQQYRDAVKWFDTVIEKSRPIDDVWLKTYREAKLTGKKGKGSIKVPFPADAKKEFPLPEITDDQFTTALRERRRRERTFGDIRPRLIRLFRDGAANRLTNKQICSRFESIWAGHNSRIQGRGWERTGRDSNWRLFARGMTAILSACDGNRDDVVASWIDEFAARKLPTRKALLSEMLCHFFPERYPVINGPVQLWIKKMKYRAPHGASEGARFVDMAHKMRATLKNNSEVENLAELDSIIWVKYGNEYLRRKRAYS